MDVTTAWGKELEAFKPVVRARLRMRGVVAYDERDVSQVATAVLLITSMGPGPLREVALQLQRELIEIGEETTF